MNVVNFTSCIDCIRKVEASRVCGMKEIEETLRRSRVTDCENVNRILYDVGHETNVDFCNGPSDSRDVI